METTDRLSPEMRDRLRSERVTFATRLRRRGEVSAEEALLMVLFPSKAVLRAQLAKRGLDEEGDEQDG